MKSPSPSQLASALARVAAFRPMAVEVIRYEGKGNSKKAKTGMYDVIIPDMGALAYVSLNTPSGQIHQELIDQAMSAVNAIRRVAELHRTSTLVTSIKNQLALAETSKQYEDIVQLTKSMGTDEAQRPVMTREDEYGLVWIECEHPTMRCVGSSAESDARGVARAWNETLREHRTKSEELLRYAFLNTIDRLALG